MKTHFAFRSVSLALYVALGAAGLSVFASPVHAGKSIDCASAGSGVDSLTVDALVSRASVKNDGAAWYALARKQADEGFGNLAGASLERALRAGGAANAGISAKAAACLGELEANGALLAHPVVEREIISALGALKLSAKERKDLETAAFRAVLRRIGDGKADGVSTGTAGGENSTIDALVVALRGNRAFASAAQGLVAAARSDYASAAKAFAKVDYAAKDLAPYQALVRLTAARSEYALGRDSAAIAGYEKLYRIGLPMQDALIESAWAQLRSKNYMKSIGLSYELTTGKLSEFFAPEALAIRAISFVENCRFPEARAAVAKFNADYPAVANYLRAQAKGGEHSLYETAIARAEGALGDEAIPAKVWSVWSGSDFFVKSQTAIKNSFAESREAETWITDEAKQAPVAALLRADLAKVASARNTATAAIESRLARLNAAMLERVEAETQRLRFVSVEANQGAGRDLIYRNANPGVKDAEKKLEKEETKAKSYKGKLGWGTVKGDDPKAEGWIDEIGQYEAKTLNRCNAKAVFEKEKAAKQ